MKQELKAGLERRESLAHQLRELRSDLRAHADWLLAKERGDEDRRREHFAASVAVVAAVLVPAGVVAGVYGANVWSVPDECGVGTLTIAGLFATIGSVSLLGAAIARGAAPVARCDTRRLVDLTWASVGMVVAAFVAVYLWFVCALRPCWLDGLALRPFHTVEAIIAAIAATLASGFFLSRVVKVDRMRGGVHSRS